MILSLTIEVQVKNLLKSFLALHRPNQGGDGGVVQLQTLKESRLQYDGCNLTLKYIAPENSSSSLDK